VKAYFHKFPFLSLSRIKKITPKQLVFNKLIQDGYTLSELHDLAPEIVKELKLTNFIS
jgi:hypothetical protein